MTRRARGRPVGGCSDLACPASEPPTFGVGALIRQNDTDDGQDDSDNDSDSPQLGLNSAFRSKLVTDRLGLLLRQADQLFVTLAPLFRLL